jgi:hypothetical protein
MPNDTVRYLFAFLFTQKKLRLLVMNDVGIENPVTFLRSMIQLINSLPLPGLDISSTDVPPDVLEQFIAALASQRHLRRLGLGNSNAGDECIDTCAAVVKELSDLNEIVADGFKCNTVAKLAAFWKEVAAHPHIVACDVPTADLAYLELEETQLDPQFQATMATLKQKVRPSTVDQRVKLTRDYIKNQEAIDTSGEIFIKTSVMGWTYVADQLGEFCADD